MKIYTIKSTQKFPISLKAAWDFFSSPHNLVKITPEHLSFVITSGGDDEGMYAGKLITYSVKPLLGIPMTWVTEITHVKDGHYFIDEQRFGPYALWHHRHVFREIPGGVEMTDTIHYALPFGILGQIAHPLLVKGKVKEIFDYRRTVLDKLFGEYKQ